MEVTNKKVLEMLECFNKICAANVSVRLKYLAALNVEILTPYKVSLDKAKDFSLIAGYDEFAKAKTDLFFSLAENGSISGDSVNEYEHKLHELKLNHSEVNEEIERKNLEYQMLLEEINDIQLKKINLSLFPKITEINFAPIITLIKENGDA
jgi:hypothetical protein